MLQHLVSVVRGFVGFPEKSQIFVGDFGLVPLLFVIARAKPVAILQCEAVPSCPTTT